MSALLTAQLATLEAAVADRKARVAKLEEESLPPWKNWRYNINFNIPFAEGVDDPTQPPKVELVESFVTKKGTRFYVRSIEFAFTVQGTVSSDMGPVPVTLGLAPAAMSTIFQFGWKVRDTGSDREWQDDFLPWSMLCSTHINGFRLGRGHCELSGGSQVLTTVGVTYSNIALGTFLVGLASLTSAQLQFNYVGVEVPA